MDEDDELEIRNPNNIRQSSDFIQKDKNKLEILAKNSSLH